MRTILLFLALFCFSQLASAQKEKQYNVKKESTVTKISPEQYKAIVAYLNSNEEDKPMANFRLKAYQVEIVCIVTNNEVECFNDPVYKCPTSVKVKLPGGATTNVDVDCTGPDSGGECDCDFAQ